jgi:hypothetical protein
MRSYSGFVESQGLTGRKSFPPLGRPASGTKIAGARLAQRYWPDLDVFRLRSEKFRLRNALCFSQAPQKILKSLGRNVRFPRFRGIQGFTTHFVSRFFPSVCDPPVGASLDLVSQNSSIARIRFQGKPKDQSPSLHLAPWPAEFEAPSHEGPSQSGSLKRHRNTLAVHFDSHCAYA